MASESDFFITFIWCVRMLCTLEHSVVGQRTTCRGQTQVGSLGPLRAISLLCCSFVRFLVLLCFFKLSKRGLKMDLSLSLSLSLSPLWMVDPTRGLWR